MSTNTPRPSLLKRWALCRLFYAHRFARLRESGAGILTALAFAKRETTQLGDALLLREFRAQRAVRTEVRCG